MNGHNFFPSSSFSSSVASERDPQFLTVPLLSFLLSFRPSSSAFEYCSHPILGRRTGEARVPKCSRGAFPRKRCVYTTPHHPARDMFDNASLSVNGPDQNPNGRESWGSNNCTTFMNAAAETPITTTLLHSIPFIRLRGSMKSSFIIAFYKIPMCVIHPVSRPLQQKPDD